LPQQFAGTTLIGNITDFHAISQKSDQYQGPNSMWSYKLKNPDLKMTIFCNLEGIVRFVSHLCPAGWSDITHLRENLPNLQCCFDCRDVVLLFDKIYVAAEKEFKRNVIYIKHKELPKTFLSEQQIIENQELAKIRRHVEFVIGDIKNRFAILEKKFRHVREYFSLVSQFCVALSSETKKYFNNQIHYSVECSGAIPDFSLTSQTTRKVVFLSLTCSIPIHL
jgi:hypothetical protein